MKKKCFDVNREKQRSKSSSHSSPENDNHDHNIDVDNRAKKRFERLREGMGKRMRWEERLVAHGKGKDAREMEKKKRRHPFFSFFFICYFLFFGLCFLFISFEAKLEGSVSDTNNLGTLFFVLQQMVGCRSYRLGERNRCL